MPLVSRFNRGDVGHKPFGKKYVVGPTSDELKKEKRDSERKAHEKKKEPLLKDGEYLIPGEIRVIKMVGSGGFGQIFQALDRKGTSMAIKTGARDSKNSPRMVLEQFILEKVSEHRNFPQFYRSGSTARVNFICMELLGPNLHQLRKQRVDERFSSSTVFRVGCQMTDALRVLHCGGYLHRDIKPSNMCVSLQEPRTVILVDFGLARRYLDAKGQLRRFRMHAGFRGTSRYASYRVHDHLEHTVWDDFWSLTYSLIEMIQGELPWKKLTDHKMLRDVKHNFVAQGIKRSSRIHPILYYLMNAEPHFRVDYEKFKKIMRVPKDLDEVPFDWEEDMFTSGSSESSTELTEHGGY